MGCRDERHSDNDELTPNDDLGQLIRQSLRDSVERAEPSPVAWQQISSRVRGKGAPRSSVPRHRRVWASLAPLAQAVMISALLLAFGLVDRNASVPRKSLVARPTPTAHTASSPAERSEDMLRGYMLFRRQPEPAQHQRGPLP
jgi:hypothetical protein